MLLKSVSLLAVILLIFCICAVSPTIAQDELGSLVALDWSPDDTQIAAIYRYGIEIIDASTLQTTLRLPLSDPIPDQRYANDLAWHSNGTKIAIATKFQIVIFDVQNSESLSTISYVCPGYNPEHGHIGAVDWSPDESQIVITYHCGMGSDERNGIRIYDVATQELISEFSNGKYATIGHQASPNLVRWLTPDRIISASVDNIILWDTDLNPVHLLNNPDGWSINAPAISIDGSRIAASRDSFNRDFYQDEIRIWDTTTGETLQYIEGYYGIEMAWNAESTDIALFTLDEISLLNLETQTTTSIAPLSQFPSVSAISNNHARIAYGYEERQGDVWVTVIEVIDFPSSSE